jgi:hypothetical protein
VYPPWQGDERWSNYALVWRELVLVLRYARVKCYICHVIGDPQLGINRFGSPLLLGYEDLVNALHRSYQVKLGCDMESWNKSSE